MQNNNKDNLPFTKYDFLGVLVVGLCGGVTLRDG